MRLPSPGLHCLCRDVPSVRRGTQHLADAGDVRQGGFTRCRWRSRFWAVLGAWHISRPIFGSPWGGRHLLTTCPQAELARKNRSEEHTSELQSRENLVCRLLLEKNNTEQGGSLTRARLEQR